MDQNSQSCNSAEKIKPARAVNIQDKSSETFRDAIISKNYRVARDVIGTLLASEANIDSRDSKGQTLLHIAAEYGHSELVKFLIQKGADVNLQDAKGWTPLLLLLKNKEIPSRRKPNVIKLLCDKGADLLKANYEGLTPLHVAAQSGPFKLVEFLIIEKEADVNLQDAKGWTPFYFAVSSGNIKMVKFLYQNGAYINSLCQAPLNIHENNPDCLTVSNEDTEIAKLLPQLEVYDILYPVPPNTQNENIDHLPQSNIHAEIARLLCQNDTYINKLYPLQLTPLQYAILKRDFKMVELLLTYGAHLDIPTETHTIRTAIQSINESKGENLQKSLDIIDLLISAGIYTGTAAEDLLNDISVPDTRNGVKKNRDGYYRTLLPLLQNLILTTGENRVTNTSLLIGIQYLLKTRFKLKSWHPYLKRLCESFQDKLAQTPRTDETSKKFLQATIQFQLIQYLQYILEGYQPGESFRPTAFQRNFDKIDNDENHSLALTRLYKTYLEPVGYPLESISSKGQTQQNILEYLENRSLTQINEGFITQFYLVLDGYMRKVLPEPRNCHPQYIRLVYDNNSSLQDELMQGWPNESQLRPSNNLRR